MTAGRGSCSRGEKAPASRAHSKRCAPSERRWCAERLECGELAPALGRQMGRPDRGLPAGRGSCARGEKAPASRTHSKRCAPPERRWCAERLECGELAPAFRHGESSDSEDTISTRANSQRAPHSPLVPLWRPLRSFALLASNCQMSRCDPNCSSVKKGNFMSIGLQGHLINRIGIRESWFWVVKRVLLFRIRRFVSILELINVAAIF